MSRIRYIKPEFFLDEDVAELSFPARLLFQGLWVLADRDGRLEDRPTLIRVQIFPYDGLIAIGELLDELAKPRKHSAGGFISRYTAGDQRFIQIKSFAAHQRPHPKEPTSKIPPAPTVVAVKRNGKKFPAVKRNGETVSSREEGKGREQEGKVEGERVPDLLAIASPPWTDRGGEAYERRFGTGSWSKARAIRFNGNVKRLVDAYGADRVIATWEWFIARTDEKLAFLTPEHFAGGFLEWESRSSGTRAPPSPKAIARDQGDMAMIRAGMKGGNLDRGRMGARDGGTLDLAGAGRESGEESDQGSDLPARVGRPHG